MLFMDAKRFDLLTLKRCRKVIKIWYFDLRERDLKYKGHWGINDGGYEKQEIFPVDFIESWDTNCVIKTIEDLTKLVVTHRNQNAWI